MSVRIATDVCARSAVHKVTWPVGQVGTYSTLCSNCLIGIIIFNLPDRKLGLGMFRNLLKIINKNDKAKIESQFCLEFINFSKI